MSMFVVTLPPSAAAHPARYAEKAKRAGADILEIRGDLTPFLEPFPSPLPILLAPRGASTERLAALRPTYLDLELHEDAQGMLAPHIIRSVHYFKETPSLSVLKDAAQSLMATGASMIKIASTVTSYRDLLTLQTLQDSLPSGVQSIVLGMGDKAHLSRLTSPLRNAFTYACLSQSESAAPGQLPLSAYSLTAHCKTPRLFGLLGGPQVRHSMSPLIHATLFSRHSIDALYSLFPADDCEEAFSALSEMRVQGFSITAPWKRAILDRIHRLDAAAERLQSVNTVIREGDEWVGCNTDMYGIAQGYPFLAECENVAIIGSGGVVPAVIAACEQLHGGARITVYARSASARRELEERFEVDARPLEDLIHAEAQAIICAVSDDVPIFLPQTHHLIHAIDLRYGKKTKFLKSAEAKGYTVHDGMSLLIHQALKQYELFTGNVPDERDIDALSSLFVPSSLLHGL